ncbi:MAG: type II toxin-antitoxin system MqsR family toxin [Tardiphaga sp.]
MAEKRVPHHALLAIQSMFSTVGGLRATWSAVQGAAALGYGRADIVAVIQAIEPAHFYKSMTSDRNPLAWQDVYHVPDAAGMLYVKFTDNAVSEMTLLSFKAR